MKQKPDYGIIKYLINKLKFFINKINPRYQLSLDDSSFDLNSKKIMYRFKSFGDHSFPKFSFDLIKSNNNILYSINPHDLIKISVQEYVQQKKKSVLKVTELLRDNKYKISDDTSEGTFTGEEICDNPLLIERISNNDLYKIAYHTGFDRGRKISKLVANELNQEKSKNNVINMKILDSN